MVEVDVTTFDEGDVCAVGMGPNWMEWKGKGTLLRLCCIDGARWPKTGSNVTVETEGRREEREWGWDEGMEGSSVNGW